ncbi:thiocillin family RiPP [Spiractinospora alimapuensis]|uniref:thiocillin family RiPP n=1 Tax=Spiractinospora alimapuensis TaxID=2820884 RepID=UPI001F3DBBCF|nr:thiocillin family RiPP [Spiractinospora alimapuensis]QVQ50243.1 thiocillin family RiPP [Spiractinospora alimapuensis]
MNDAPELYLYSTDDDLTVEELPEGGALSTFACGSSASTASCPGSSAASLSSASCAWS